MNKLQLFLLGGAAVLIALAVLVFSGAFGFGDRSGRTNLVMWGTLPKTVFNDISRTIEQSSNGALKLSYEQKTEARYEQELLEALAAGVGPDLWIIPAEWHATRASLIAPLPTALFTEREFTERFVDSASVFIAPARSEGRTNDIVALPLAFDPLVLYWNKDLFNAAAIAAPPRDWTELIAHTRALTRRTPEKQIEQSGAALGRASNIPSFKKILELLMLQENPRQTAFLEDIDAANSATRYYTNFASSFQNHFSWHALLAAPRDLFSENRLAMMFDYASYANPLTERNPHLNAAYALVPQIDATRPVTTGSLWGITVSRSSAKGAQAWQAALLLTNKEIASLITERANIVPVHRGLLKQDSLLHASVLQAKILSDPNPAQTSAILANMIDTIADGRKTVSEAVAEAKRKLESLQN